MSVFRAFVLLFVFAAPLAAQTFPGLYDVTGVAADDILNVRAEPDAASEVVATLAPDAQSVEIITLSDTGKWALVNVGEGSGWTAFRFLRRIDGAAELPLATAFTCFGTEPFWALDVTQGDTADFSLMGEPVQVYDVAQLQATRGRTDRFAMVLSATDTLVVGSGHCDDGMSDRAFGLTSDVIQRQDGFSVLSGCCTLSQ